METITRLDFIRLLRTKVEHLLKNADGVRELNALNASLQYRELCEMDVYDDEDKGEWLTTLSWDSFGDMLEEHCGLTAYNEEVYTTGIIKMDTVITFEGLMYRYRWATCEMCDYIELSDKLWIVGGIK